MTVQIYTTPTCSWCEKLRTWLKKKNISFIEHDITESDKARDEALEKSSQLGVPVIDVDGKIITGFHEKELESVLKDSQ